MPSCLLSWTPSSFWNRVRFPWEQILSFFRIDPFSEGRQTNFERVASRKCIHYLYTRVYCMYNKHTYCMYNKHTKGPNHTAWMYRLFGFHSLNMAYMQSYLWGILEIFLNLDFFFYKILQALELLPPSIKIKDILGYLENVLELKSATKHQSQVLRNMLFSESLQVCWYRHSFR